MRTHLWRRKVAASGLATLFVACGRLNFDPVADAAMDGTSLACSPSKPEVCNGIDDDCDEQIDEDCPCTAFDASLPSTGLLTGPSIEWTGNGYLVELDDGSGWSVALVDAGGVPVTSQQIVTYGAAAPPGAGAWSGNQMAWSGSELVVAYTDPMTPATVHVRTFDAKAAPIGGSVDIAGGARAGYVAIAWAGDRFVIAWMGAQDGQVRLLELAPSGSPLSSEIVIPTMLNLHSIVATAAGYLVVVGTGTNPVTDAPAVAFIARTPDHTSTVRALALPSCCDSTPIARAPGGFVALRGTSSNPPVVQRIDALGVPAGTSAVPTFVMAAPYIGSVSGTPTSYRVVLTEGAMPTQVSTASSDATGALGPANGVTTFSASAWSDPTIRLFAGREVIVLPLMMATRIIQQCN